MTNRKKSHRRSKTGLILLVLVLAIALIAFIAIRAEMSGGRNTGEMVPVTIEMGSSTTDIAGVLKEAGLIHNKLLFRLYSRQRGADGTYQYGEFQLEKGSSYAELIKVLTTTVAFRETVTVTFPEGYNAFQMAKAVEEAGLCSYGEFLEAANATDYDFDFMSEISSDSRKLVVLDGFLFPDTYSFYPEDTARDVVTAMLKNFQTKVLTEETKASLSDSGFSLEELAIFASILQKESANVEEMYNVSSVFHNRLQNGSEYPMLQSCTTNNYLWDYIEPYYSNSVPQTVLDAYDTYGKEGLPVGAIANAGTDAFDAALHPNDTPYYFFVTDVEYHHYYASSYAEHLQNIEKAKAVNKTYGIDGLVTK